MKTYQTKTELKEIRYDYRYYCDWCKNIITGNGAYNTNEFTLQWKWGDSFPEGGSGEELTVDLCIDCRIKLFNYLKSQNCTVQRNDWDY